MSKRISIIFAVFLVLEAFGVRNSAFQAVKRFANHTRTKNFITSTTIDRTLPSAFGRDHYLQMENAGSVSCFDSLGYRTSAMASEEPSYRGEIYLLPSSGSSSGSARLLAYTPGKIEFSYSCLDKCVIGFNTNYLKGWNSSLDKTWPTSTDRGLLSIELPPGSSAVNLDYTPPYLPFVWTSLVVAWLLWLGLLLSLNY